MCLFFALLLETVYADTIWNHVILIFGVHIIQNRIFGRNLESYVSLLWLVLRNRTRGHNLESLDSPFLIIIINRTHGWEGPKTTVAQVTPTGTSYPI